jgi:putative lipoic acid-binding regulatory protein
MSQDPWKGLREKLEERKWPAVYLFKFIVPADNQKVAQTEALFDSETAQIELRKSKTGKFVSVSAKEMMMDVDSVIQRYEDAVKIPGLMAL